jgi:hypothetical protein
VSTEKAPSPQKVVSSFLARLAPETQKLARATRAAIRKRYPTANELAYDYGKHFVLSYSPTEHGIDGPLALAGRAEGVQLYFGKRKQLKDPEKRLQGSAQVRFVWVESVKVLSDPYIVRLMTAAVALARVPFPKTGKGRVLLRETSASKRG